MKNNCLEEIFTAIKHIYTLYLSRHELRSVTTTRQWLYISTFFILSMVLTSDKLHAQNDIPTDTIAVDSTEAERLGLFNKENQKTFSVLLSGKPAKAGLYSLLFPGAGQAYNKKYWKIPIVWGVVGYFGYQALQSENTYKEIDDTYRCLLKGKTCSYQGITDAAILAPWRKKAKSARERMWVTFSLIYIIQAIEAYIDRHLIEFDMDENLSFKSYQTPKSINFGIYISLN